jgi:uncharacterized protein (DUF2342 family)
VTTRAEDLADWVKRGFGGVLAGETPPETDAAEIRRLVNEGLSRAETTIGVSVDSPSMVAVAAVSQRRWAESTASIIAGLLNDALPIIDRASLEATAAKIHVPTARALRGLEGGYEELYARVSGMILADVARDATGSCDLPLGSSNSALLIIPANIKAFASAWDLPDPAALNWVCAYQSALAVIYAQPAVSAHLRQMEVQYFAPRDIETDPTRLDAELAASFSRVGPRLTIDVDAAFESFRAGGEPGVADNTEALASVAHACAWFAVHKSLGSKDEAHYERMLEIAIRRQSEPPIWKRWAETWLGMPLGPIARPDAILLIESIAEVLGTSGLGSLWLDEGHLPTPQTLVEPAAWLIGAGIEHSLAGAVQASWERRLAAVAGHDLRGGRAAAPGQRPILGRRHVTLWPEEERDVEAMQKAAQGFLGAPELDDDVAEPVRGELAGLSVPGTISLLGSDNPVSTDYFRGYLAGHLCAYMVRQRGPVGSQAQNAVRAYTSFLARREDVQRALAMRTADALLQAHEFVMRQIGVNHPERLAEFSADDERLFFSWLLEQTGLVATPRLLAACSRVRSERGIAPPH